MLVELDLNRQRRSEQRKSYKLVVEKHSDFLHKQLHDLISDKFDSLLNNSLHSNLEGLEAKPLLSNSSYIGLNSINIPPIIKAHFL
jgi:hypothetical protein